MQTDIVTNWSRKPPATPWVTMGATAMCVAAATLYATLTPLWQQAFVEVVGVVPSRLSAAFEGGPSNWAWSGIWPAFGALFIHSSWLHLLGNLAYLWVFGVQLERAVGGAYLALLFLIGGAVANLLVALRLPSLNLPVIGASGAVSAVVGAYLGLFPRRKIGLYLPLGLYVQFARVPAVLIIGSWFTLQLVYSVFGPISGSVAWWTHLAGFTLGLISALLVRAGSHLSI